MTRTDPQTAATAAPPDRSARDERAGRWERRLAAPVVVAALVSVPAVFLTMLEPRPLVMAGYALNWASLVVLGGEMVLLVVLSGDKLAWIKRHKWTLTVTVVAVPAVIFAFAPVQALRLLRLARLIGTLRILRAKTIISAGRTIARRSGLTGPWKYLLVLAASVVAAVFVALVLVDPTSVRQHQELIEEVTGWRWSGMLPALSLIAGTILAVSTFIVVRNRRRDQDEEAARRSRDE